MSDADPVTRQRYRPSATVVAIGVLVIALLAVFVVNRVQTQRAHDRLSDAYYCTLSGVGPMDHAPKTGALCADLLGG